MGLKSSGSRSSIRNISENIPPGFVLTNQGATIGIPESGVARYNFEQDLTDSWNNNDASVSTGSVSYTTTSNTGTYAADLTNSDSLDTGIATFDTPFTISTWINPQEANTSNTVWGTYNSGSNDLYLNDRAEGDWKLAADSANTQRIYGGTVSTGTYVLITAVVSDSDMRLYDNETEIASTTNRVAQTYDNGNTLRINDLGDGSKQHNSLYDDFRVYDKALTATEVSNLYNNGDIRVS